MASLADIEKVLGQFRDPDGQLYGVKHVDGKPRVVSSSYMEEIARGLVPSHSVFRILGLNIDVDTAIEDMWEVGGSYVFPTSGMRMEVISSSAGDEDSAAGTGIQEVEIDYLDDLYVPHTERVVPDGNAAVATVATNIFRINGFHTTKVGATGGAVGTVDLRHLNTTPIYARIGIGNNDALQAIWTVPTCCTAYIVSWQGGAVHNLGGRMARFVLKATASKEHVYVPGVFYHKDHIPVQDGAIFIPINAVVELPEKTDIRMTAQGDAGNSAAICSCEFEGWIEKN